MEEKFGDTKSSSYLNPNSLEMQSIERAVKALERIADSLETLAMCVDKYFGGVFEVRQYEGKR